MSEGLLSAILGSRANLCRKLLASYTSGAIRESVACLPEYDYGAFL